MPVAVNGFGYVDHRQLLRDLFAARKAQGRGFSHRAFALRVGLRSTNYLKLVMDCAVPDAMRCEDGLCVL